MQERLDHVPSASESASGSFPPRGPSGAVAIPAACVAGAATLLVGGVCLVDAFVVPGLFGPVAAVVVATERLLCAARAQSARTTGAWAAIALGWVAVASCMLHAPWMGSRALPWAVAVLVVSTVALRWRSGPPASVTATAAQWVVAIGGASQLAILYGPLFAAQFGAPSTPLVQLVAAAAIELLSIGVVRLLDAACLRSAVQAAMAQLPPRAHVAATAEMFDLEAGIA